MKESGKSNSAIAVVARRLRCPTCARRYRLQDITQLDQDEQRAVFKLRCPLCLAERLIIARWEGKRVELLYTELDQEEWTHYHARAAIQSDDVIQMHCNMQTYDGDLSDILEDPLLQDSSLNE